MHRGALALLALLVAGCPTTPPAEDPLFPEDFWDTYRVTRECRPSHDHELRYIRIFADDLAYPSHIDVPAAIPYPVGSTLVKPEYYDENCETLLEYTVMVKLERDTDPALGDWAWQRVTLDHRVVNRNEEVPARCVTCHEWHCGELPYGYDYTCPDEMIEPPPPR